jgi:aerobic-type carbon monoxide dehydrogenase small subunit (CoxS/CutS family)
MVELTVNGQARKFDGDGDGAMPILWYLRDELDLFAATGKRIRDLPIKRTKLV